MKTSISTRTMAALLVTMLTSPLAHPQAQPEAAQTAKSRHTRYTIVDLGAVGGPPGQAYVVNNLGLVAGAAAAENGTMRSTLWYGQRKFDLGTLGGPNSAAFGINDLGEVVGGAQKEASDSEDFCGFNALGLAPTSKACVLFFGNLDEQGPYRRWGAPTARPT